MTTDLAGEAGRRWRPVEKIGLLLGVALMAAALSLLAGRTVAGRSASAAPELVCERAEHDFGLVPLARARQLEHTFRLTNTGGQPVRITAVRTTCGCTAADPVGADAAPGADLEIPIKADWSAKAGPVEQVILVETSSLATPQIFLRIKGHIQVPVAVSPATIHLGALKSGEVVTRRVRVGSGTATQPVAITSVSSSSGDVFLLRADGQGQPLPAAPLAGSVGEFLLRVQAPEAVEPSRRDESITFQTDHPDVPSLALRVEFQVEPAIQASPGTVLLARNAQGYYEPQRIRVTCPGEQPVTADLLWEGPGPSPFRLCGSVLDDGQRDSGCFTVSFAPAEGRPGACRARLVLKGDHCVRHIPIIAY